MEYTGCYRFVHLERISIMSPYHTFLRTEFCWEAEMRQLLRHCFTWTQMEDQAVQSSNNFRPAEITQSCCHYKYRMPECECVWCWSKLQVGFGSKHLRSNLGNNRNYTVFSSCRSKARDDKNSRMTRCFPKRSSPDCPIALPQSPAV